MRTSRVGTNREQLVLAYVPLCRRAARRFVRDGLERTDLEQVAAIGLLKAADRFDPRRETPFEAFAWVAVIGELLHFVRDHEHLVRLPRSLSETLPRFRRSADRMMQSLEREATERELARDLQSSVEEIRALREAFATVARTAAVDAERELARVPALDWNEWCERLDLDEALARLPLRERHVVIGTYLIGLTNGELAVQLSLSTRHVARLRRRALARMLSTCRLAVSA